jgi:hypothetical protein
MNQDVDKSMIYRIKNIMSEYKAQTYHLLIVKK